MWVTSVAYLLFLTSAQTDSPFRFFHSVQTHIIKENQQVTHLLTNDMPMFLTLKP